MGEDPNQRGASRRWIIRRSRTRCAGSAPTRSTSTRCTAPTRRPTSRRRSARSTDLVRSGKVRYIGTRPSRPSQIVEAQWAARDRGLQPLRDRAAAVLDPRPRHRARRAADRASATAWASSPTARSPAAGSRALPPRQRRPTRRSAGSGCQARFDMSLPANQRKLEAADAARRARRRGRHHAHPARDRLRRSTTRRSPRRSSARARWSTSSRQLAAADVVLDADVLDRIDEIVPPGTNLNPADAGWTLPSLREQPRRRCAREREDRAAQGQAENARAELVPLRVVAGTTD